MGVQERYITISNANPTISRLSKLEETVLKHLSIDRPNAPSPPAYLEATARVPLSIAGEPDNATKRVVLHFGAVETSLWLTLVQDDIKLYKVQPPQKKMYPNILSKSPELKE